jgi:predicted ATPase/DNA-binding SARP family transcriptional activator
MHSSNLVTLGGFAFSVNGISASIPATRKARALMAFLIMNREAQSARERLLEIFWPDVDPDSARHSLNTALHSIRRCLRMAGVDADAFLVATKSIVRWTADTAADAVEFEEIATKDDPIDRRDALELYRGDFLEGDYDDWAVGERERLAALYESVLAKAVRTSRDSDAARRLLVRNPYAEDAYAVLIEAELGAGRHTSATALVERCRKAMSEVDEIPSPAFEERFGHIGRRSLDVPPSNLPRQTTSFVGRGVESSEVRALLTKSRLVTIVGVGGVGKTRVALHVGAQLRDAFEDGAWFVDLAKVSGADSVVPEIASAYEITSQGFSALFDRVLAHMKNKRLLLILDNCEHVVVEAARVAGSIITVCPQVTILATSREAPLGVGGEHVYLLPPLDVPPSAAESGAENALKFSAVALFVERARAINAHFPFTDDNAAEIGEICLRLDGIALAIELAAARVMTLSVQQLLERLREQFQFLKGVDRAAHPRHQTMRATLDWSYNWLSETERAMFRRLAIFQGGWTIEAVPAAWDVEPLDDVAILDNLSSLVNKSLVAVKFSAQTQRYRLMEPLRQYGLERLKVEHEFDGTARRHAQYFAEFARQAADTWNKMPELTWLGNIEADLDNIRAALEWSLSQGNDLVLGAETAAHLGNFWFSRHYHEGLRWLELAQRSVSYEDYPMLSVEVAVSRMRSYIQADIPAALRVFEEAQGFARSLNEEVHLRRLLLFRGHALLGENRLDEAEIAATECVEKSERGEDPYRLAFGLCTLARLNRRRGNFDVARELSKRMTQVYEGMQLSLDRNRWIVLTECARVEQLDGHLARAIELCREAHSIPQLTRDPPSEVQTEYCLTALLLLSGAVDEARAHGRSLLKLSREELLSHGIAPALQVLAGVATRRANHDIAARLLGYAEARFPAQTIARDQWVEVDPQWFIQPLRDHFGVARLAELMAEGVAWSEDHAVEEALRI